MSDLFNHDLALFELGRVCGNRHAVDALERRGLKPMDYVKRHALGDFGEIEEDSRQANLLAIQHGERVFSQYEIPPHASDTESHVWVITERDRSVTTLLLPSNY